MEIITHATMPRPASASDIGTTQDLLAIVQNVPKGGAVTLSDPSWVQSQATELSPVVVQRRRFRDLIRARLAVLWQQNKIPRMHIYLDMNEHVTLCHYDDFAEAYPERFGNLRKTANSPHPVRVAGAAKLPQRRTG
jgi:hypothetical protein